MRLERLGKKMENTINVTKAEDVIEMIAELIGGIDDDEELFIEIEVRQVEPEKDK